MEKKFRGLCFAADKDDGGGSGAGKDDGGGSGAGKDDGGGSGAGKDDGASSSVEPKTVVKRMDEAVKNMGPGAVTAVVRIGNEQLGK